VVLVFDVWSDIAMFRKPYTTTSQVSFAFPPPTAIAGLVSAIVGTDHGASLEASKADFWNGMKNTRVAIGLLSPVRWFSTTINLLKFKTPNGNMDEHIQSKHQMLKQPRYRIYLQDGNLYASLKCRLERKEFIFTPCLGTAYAIAEMQYVGEYEEKPVNDQETWVDSIVPLYNGVHLDVMKSRGLHRERVPFQMNGQRELLQTVSVIYPEIEFDESTGSEVHSKRIWLKGRGKLDVSQVGEERVSWFERWGNLESPK